jgi:uncharacterized protein (DUF486 family)
MPVIARTVALLLISNLFMTFAWYAHLRNLAQRPWLIAALASWGIALFEYLFQVPANRLGHTELSLGQLKILQEVITLSVFVPFALLVHEGAGQTQLSVGGVVHVRGRLLHVSEVTRARRGNHSRCRARGRCGAGTNLQPLHPQHGRDLRRNGG